MVTIIDLNTPQSFNIIPQHTYYNKPTNSSATSAPLPPTMPPPPLIPSLIITPTSTEFKLSYKVQLLESHVPSAGLHAYQYALFVEMHHNGTGSIFHIKGNVYDGMQYERITDTAPFLHRHFSKMDCIGSVDCWKFADFKEICAGVPPPGRQSDEPLYRSVDWCEDVIRVLRDRRVLDKVA
jgi:hypothetical protein